MTPKEKAKELVEKFKEYANDFYTDYASQYELIDNVKTNAKECALIAVNELIYEVYSISHQYTAIYDITTSSYLYNDSKELTFWKEVKEEIKNL